MRILITGSRRRRDGRKIGAAIDETARLYFAHRPHLTPDVTIVHGAAQGADTLAGLHARANGYHIEAHPAAWDRFGRGAGHVRNQAMVRAGADACLVFPTAESVGAWDCVRRAQAAGIPVWVFEP